jgi:hypothetical protein
MYHDLRNGYESFSNIAARSEARRSKPHANTSSAATHPRLLMNFGNHRICDPEARDAPVHAMPWNQQKYWASAPAWHGMPGRGPVQ